MANGTGPKLSLRNPARSSRRYKARKSSAAKPRRKSTNDGGMLTLMKAISANPRRKAKKKYTAKRKNRSASTRHKHRNTSAPRKRYTAKRRRKASNPTKVVRRRYRAKSRNPFGASYPSLLKDGGVALVSAVLTRAVPATISSMTGINNSGIMGYGMNIAAGAAAAFLAEKFLKAGYPAAIGATVAIANRVVDDYTGVEVLNANTFQQLTAGGMPAAQAAAQATTVTAASPTGVAGLGRFDRKWSFVGSSYSGYRSTSFPPATAYPGPGRTVATGAIPAGASGPRAVPARRTMQAARGGMG